METDNNILKSYKQILILLRLSKFRDFKNIVEENPSILLKDFFTSLPNHRETLLEIASRTNKTAIAHYLIDKIKTITEFPEKNKVLALNYAIQNRDNSLCQKFLDLDIDPWFQNEIATNPNIYSPIHQAVKNQNITLLQTYHNHGVSLIKTDFNGNNLLHVLINNITMASPFYLKNNKKAYINMGEWLINNHVSWEQENKMKITPKDMCVYSDIENELSKSYFLKKAKENHHMISSKITNKLKQSKNKPQKNKTHKF